MFRGFSRDGTSGCWGTFGGRYAHGEGVKLTTAGYLLLVVAFSLSAIAAISLLCSGVFGFAVHVGGRPSVPTVLKAVGRISSLFAFAALAGACALLVWCFASGDNSLRYVVEYRSDAKGVLGWLYRLSGLWVPMP